MCLGMFILPCSTPQFSMLCKYRICHSFRSPVVHILTFSVGTISQSIILAFITTRLSNRMWVKTEALELSHYVEVREEFDRVQALLKQGNSFESKKSGSSTSDDDQEEMDDNPKNSNSTVHETEYNAAWRGPLSYVSGVVDYCRRPRLWNEYNSLLIQVRFHELRVHFLQSYNLPPSFKISDYLVRCELHVLLKLVHVSLVGWLLLTASFNLLYFILGVEGYFKQSSEVVGVTLLYVFFFSLFGFVFLALLVFFKVKRIFQVIMHRHELWDTTQREEKHNELAKEQMGLFLFGSPKLVISALQFMQFGYAVALATVLMFWETFDDADIAMMWYFISIFLCYALFVAVAAHVIPRYTLCTSLGQLVDKKRLNQAVAQFHLEEAKRQRQQEAYQFEYNEGHPLMSYHSTMQETELHTQRSAVSSVSSDEDASGRNVNIEMDLDGMDTPTDEEASYRRRLARRNRRKCVSDGVALMASIKDDDAEEKVEEAEDLKEHGDSGDHDEKARPSLTTSGSRRNRRKAVSEGVHLMANTKFPTGRPGLVSQESQQRIASLVSVDTASLREQLSKDEMMKLDHKGRLGTKRTKSKSDPDKVKRLVGNHDEENTNGKKRSYVPGLTATLGFRPLPADRKENDVKHVDDVEHVDDDDDNFSDVDDIPVVDRVHLDEFRKENEERAKRASLKVQLKGYFTPKKFPVLSNVFGTMVAFFIVGSRVERFLHTEDIVPRDFISFDFNEVATFWILSTYFFCFIATDSLVLYTVDRRGSTPRMTRKARVVWLASVLDMAIVAVCWIVFWVAEIQRCCESTEASSEERWLAGDVKNDEGYGPAPCSCPTFGSRLHGGLGTIEPYTSLIALRLFRFFIARKIVRKKDLKHGVVLTAEEVKADLHDEQNLDPFNIHESDDQNEGGNKDHKHEDGHGHESGKNDHGDHGHGHGHDHHRGTAAELWETAIAQHPEIVEKHGMFSGEILQLMLGLPLSQNAVNNVEGSAMGEISGDVVPKLQPQGRSSYVIENKFSSLSVGAQEIIMQGKLGQKVKTVSKLKNVQTIPEDAETQERQDTYMFEVSSEPSLAPLSHLDQQSFDAPNARLVRSMRRCDRKLLPILNKWTVVDVVMTRFEMVYFDATGTFDGAEVDSSMQALQATKGGKGLRLKDVAQGRKVVGLMKISEITSLAIERYMPSENGHDVDEEPMDIVPETEFWKDGTVNYSRAQVWPRIKQDTLAVHTSHGNTLYLRFYSDLEEIEAHKDDPANEKDDAEELTKNNAFQWIQTIGRFCGPEQLHQSLPHFGGDNDAELRDYLVVHHQHEHKRQLNFLANHGPNMRHNRQETVSAMMERSSKRFNLMKLSSFHQPGLVQDQGEGADDGEVDTNARRKPFSRRSLSLGDTGSDETGQQNVSGPRVSAKKSAHSISRSSSFAGDARQYDKESEHQQANELRQLSSPDDLMPTLHEGDHTNSAADQQDDTSPV